MHRASAIVPLLLATGLSIGCGSGEDLVTPPPPPPDPVLTALEISPASVTLYSTEPGNTGQLVVTPKDQSGQTMTGLGAATFTVSNPAVLTVSTTGLVTAVGLGTATVTASLTAGGSTKTAAATVVVQEPPTGAAVSAAPTVNQPGVPRWDPREVHIRAGGTVAWSVQNIILSSMNVVFADQSIESILVLAPGAASVSRTFPVRGTYAYVCTLHPASMSGTVIVH
jgi:plastocyanin